MVTTMDGMDSIEPGDFICHGSQPGKRTDTMVVTVTDDRPAWTRLTGMHGPLWVNGFTGAPRSPRETLPGWYPHIERVDWAEYMAWKAILPAGVALEPCLDDFGVQYVDGSYEPADPDSRQSTLDNALAEMENDDDDPA